MTGSTPSPSYPLPWLPRGHKSSAGTTGQEVEEAAESASDEVGKRLAEIASRLSGWGSQSLDMLVEAVTKAASVDERGRSLEELVGRLFETIPGFTVTDRIKTATEEIDIAVLNDSTDPRFKRESAILLAECKNWSGKCGKNELKVSQRC
jgi:hypothetical protein